MTTCAVMASTPGSAFLGGSMLQYFDPLRGRVLIWTVCYNNVIPPGSKTVTNLEILAPEIFFNFFLHTFIIL